MQMTPGQTLCCPFRYQEACKKKELYYKEGLDFDPQHYTKVGGAASTEKVE